VVGLLERETTLREPLTRDLMAVGLVASAAAAEVVAQELQVVELAATMAPQEVMAVEEFLLI
jgi:hypothetical protein